MAKKLKIGIVVLLIITTVILINRNRGITKSTLVKLSNDVEIRFNSDFKVEEVKDRQYIFIPINTNMEELNFDINPEEIRNLNEGVENLIRNIDTFIPGETEIIIQASDGAIVFSIIVE